MNVTAGQMFVKESEELTSVIIVLHKLSAS